MQGTFINVFSIIIGSLIGKFFGIFIKDKYGDHLIQTMGLIATALGISWIAKNLPNSTQPLLFIGALVIGTFLGVFFNIQNRINALQNQFDDTESGKPNIIQGLTTTTLLFCLGTLSILGPIKAALEKEFTLLYTNAFLDGVTCIVFAATYGFRIALTAIFLFIWQGSIYLSASFIEPYMTAEMFTEMNIIGGILIMATGLNILNITKIPVLNILPALFISMAYMMIFT